MFRKMKKEGLTQPECIEILQSGCRGVLSVSGDEGYPYGIPMNYYYENGKIYFHSGKTGHKIDAIEKHNKASFCVVSDPVKKEDDWALCFKSVIVFGKITFITDREKIIEFVTKLSHKFTKDDSYINLEIEKYLDKTACFYLETEHITGKSVEEK